MKRVLAALALLASAPALGCGGRPAELLFADRFDKGMDNWVAEYKRGQGQFVGTRANTLTMDVAGGATVWYKHKLAGNLRIAYTRKVLMDKGRNDRLSDLNQFWMATDPRKADLFTRAGEFSEYDHLSLYYLGFGGNTNSTTRFRKYDGKGERELLTDLAGPLFMLAPNRAYRIEISVYQGCTSLSVDGKGFVQYQDPAPLREGYFGLRTTWSRQEVSDFSIHALE